MIESQEAAARETLRGRDPAPEPASIDAVSPAPATDPVAVDATSPLIRRGNPLRWRRGAVPAAVASLLAVMLMGHEGQLRWGVPLGIALVAVAAWAVMDWLGTFDDADDRVAHSTSIAALARPLALFAAAWLAFTLTVGLAAAGVGLPGPAWGVVITLVFVGAVATTFDLGVHLGVWKLVEEGVERPLWKREGFWVVATAAALYFPFMGTYSLWDPWETHYGEVAREMLARDDWISLWWAQDGWFWSKPVLDMWMQAIAMATLGVHYQPDKMLIGNGTLPLWHPEWAVRAPVVLLTILSMYLLYKGVARSFGRRAAWLGSLALATMPDWYFLAHQTMTDMPFVAPMTACMGLVLLGLRTPESLETRAFEVKVGAARLRLTGWHLVFGAILLCAIPQILYLVSRNVEFLWRSDAKGFHAHWDEFRSGSGMANCGLPGNEECKSTLPAFIPHSTGPNPTTFGPAVWRTIGAFEPAVQALTWAVALGVALYLSWGERRVRRLYYLAAWFFAAISTLGKGPAGFGLPILVTLAYLAASRPGEEFLARMIRVFREIAQFELVAGFLVILAVAMPWYVAMYVRHGPPFTDRLIFHDMFNRAFHHVHDTNEGDDTSFRFYVWQLGYALFPWSGLAPLGLMWWFRRSTSDRDGDRADAAVLLCMWFVFGFALFSFMGTKFHHYIFPAVPPVAMLIGVVLDDMLGEESIEPRRADPRRLALYVLGLVAGSILMVLGIARMQPGPLFGFKRPESPAIAGSIPIGAVLFLLGAGVTWLVVDRLWPRLPAKAAATAMPPGAPATAMPLNAPATAMPLNAPATAMPPAAPATAMSPGAPAMAMSPGAPATALASSDVADAPRGAHRAEVSLRDHVAASPGDPVSASLPDHAGPGNHARVALGGDAGASPGSLPAAGPSMPALPAALVETGAVPAVVVETGAVPAVVVAPVAADRNERLVQADENRAHASRMLAAGSIGAALLVLIVARDLVYRGEASDQPGAIRLLHLFTYNYRRPWPDSLDFSGALVGFSAVTIVVLLALAAERLRKHAVALMCALAFVWAAWGLDVYMQQTGQHWGQHEVIAAYYADRASPNEMLVAYQMNWKGENFYTGNHIPAFVSTGATFTSWLKKQRDGGAKVMYFVTEAGRVGGLKSEVGAKSYREVTDKVVCNKFTLVRAQL